MSLRPNIQNILAILQKVIPQAPLDKQQMITGKISRIVDKYSNLDSQLNDPSYLRELEFNLNFIKLSFPHLDYTPPVQKTETQEKSQESRASEQFFQLENKQQVQKFMEETQKVLKGVRDEVEFTNWTAGNFDPEHLKRHKQLLRRQYFGGQFWKDKPKPISPTAMYLMNMMQNQPQRRHQQIVMRQDQPVTFEVDPDKRWQKVKR